MCSIRFQTRQNTTTILVISITSLISAISLVLYCLHYTLVVVYVSDYLNIRRFSLPVLVCAGCNNFTFRYPVDNPNFCGTAESDIFLLILVATFHANLEGREAIRKTWGNVTSYREKTIKTLFLLGLHEDKNLNSQVQFEMERFGDVVQADFIDDYHWLTNKTMSGLNWVREFCPNARFIMKTDDDSFNMPQRFVDYLINVHTTRFIGGYCFTVMPDRRHESKFYVSHSMYPDEYYPTFCSGPGYVLSRTALEDIVSVSNNVIFLPMEDVFVTGVCRVVANISYTQIIGILEEERQMTRCKLATWVKNGHNIYPGKAVKIWASLEGSDEKKVCLERNVFSCVILFLFLFIWCKHLKCLFTEVK